MKVLQFTLVVVLVTGLFTQCNKDSLNDGLVNDLKKADLPDAVPSGTYTVTVENISHPYDYFEAGVQPIPDGKDAAGPALPGESYTFSFHAGPNHKLSIATMYGWSNDGFFAFGDDGISLYEGGSPIGSSDPKNITSEVMLWDAGTEENQAPGEGNMHDGANVTNGMVQLMSTADPVNNYGTVATNLEVWIEYKGNSMFTVTVQNLLETSLTPISPVVWVVHSADQNPIFTEGETANDNGIEDVAETGNPVPLSSYLEMNSGYVSPIAPVLWVLHDKKDFPIFMEGTPAGDGLETLAETGLPVPLYNSLMEAGYETGFQIGPGGMEKPPIFPGQMIQFTFEGHVGQSLSLAAMLGASNDIFFSTGDEGIKLDNGMVEKDITHFIKLYDAGTEVNEYPGAQTQANTEEDGVVQLVDDGLPWPDASQVIKVTIKKN